MIGYPTGLWDEVNNQPVFRRGITATHPAKDFCGRSEFVIDAACFPGSSGSPVLLFNTGGYVRGREFRLGSRVKLLGVLYAGPVHTAQGTVIVRTIPTAQQVYSETGIPTNLGYVIKAERLKDFGPLLQQIRDDHAAGRNDRIISAQVRVEVR